MSFVINAIVFHRLVIAVAKDLQNHFEKHFPHFLELIVNLLDTKDTEILENAFTTLAHLCKILWKYFVKDIDTTFDRLLPLLADDKPEYVRNFAAESFAFVARKARNRESFFNTVLNRLAVTANGTAISKKSRTAGCGRLLFEVISGVTNQFHSCAEDMLNLYLTALVSDTIDQQLSLALVREIFNCINNQISPKHSSIFWSVILKTLEKNSSPQLINSTNELMIKQLTHLIRDVVNYRGGKMLVDPVSLSAVIVKIIPIYQNNNEVLKEIIDLSVAILLADAVKLNQETSHQLISKLIAIENRQSLIYVIEQLVEHPSFETTILPRAINYSILKDEFTDNELGLFARIILGRAMPSLAGDDLQNWRQVNLDLRKFPVTTIDFIRNILTTMEHNNHAITVEVVRTIIILPHINPPTPELTVALKNLFAAQYFKLMAQQPDNLYTAKDEQKMCFVLLLALKSLIHMMDVKSFGEWIEAVPIELTKLMTKYSHSRHIINFVDLFLTHISYSELRTNYINDATFLMVHNCLGPRLTSPDRRVRLCLCHIYSLYNNVKEALIDANGEGPHAMETIYKAELVDKSVNIDRDRLLHLQALSFESHALINLQPKYHEFPIRTLMGNFYINFSPLWKRVSTIIASYATTECKPFWDILMCELKNNNRRLEIAHRPNEEYIEDTREYFNCIVLQTWLQKFENNDKPDYINYKILLWKCMGEFASYCEARNRDFTGIFIDFVQNNIFRGNNETSRSFSIIKKINTDNDKLANDDDNAEKCEDNKSLSNFKLLMAQLQFFAKMQNPKTLYREPELKQIFTELLISKSVEIQKCALDCLFAYKNKNLQPYKDHLYNLIDEKNLRNELALFKIADDEKTEQIVANEDRDVLMPILLRILYAKMITRGSGRASTGEGALVRRKIILRFLMGIKEHEMMIFARMAFKLSEKYGISFNPTDTIPNLTILTANIERDIDLTNIIPPKRLRSMVNLLGIVVEDFGAKMTFDLLPRLLAILLSILAHVKAILDQSSCVLSGFLPVIKEVRTTCIGILARFFTHFENYNWSTSELDALFNVAVFPWIIKLPSEGVFSPTTLLKLLSAWCHNPRYFSLLVKHPENNTTITCLPYVIELLLEKRTHSSVVNTILEMIEKLLTLKDCGTDTPMDVDDVIPALPLQPHNILQINPAAVLPGFELNYGSALLLPHVPNILAYIERKFRATGINRIETTILARISELNLDPNTSNQLIALSLPILVTRAKRGESHDVILQLLETIFNFVKTVDKPEIHIRSILPLLLSISFSEGRKLLIKLLMTIARRADSTVTQPITINHANLLTKLNAMESGRIDQPDIDKRLDAYDEIKTLAALQDNEATAALSPEFGVAVLYNSYHFLKEANVELALKNSTGDCLHILGPKLAKIYKENSKDRKYLVEDTMLNLLRHGIKSKNSVEKESSISLLGIMALKCSDVHPVLRDLFILTNENDQEVDFFENIRHLQLHRRERALLKFCTISQSLKKAPNTKTLTQFIFPLASYYLCNEYYNNKNSLIDAAIKTVGTVCQLLPWHQYAVILKYYLDKLRTSNEFQKQIVRIIVAILDAFHYDLTKGTSAGKQMTQLPEVINKEVEQVGPATEDTLDDDLEKEPEDEEDTVESKESPDDQTIMDKPTLLSQYAAVRVITEIRQHHITKLNRAILASTHHELSHKSTRKRTKSENEEKELLRVPIALALVKLLQKLPKAILNENLPGIFMKLCTFLKSRLQSVRIATREILQKIMLTLGPDYLHILLKEMNSLLTKGFQIHVLAFTMHAVLMTLKPLFKPEHMIINLQSILQVCKVDLFGLSAEEKEIGAITKNVNEAKSTKSYDMFHIMSEFISENCLMDLIAPLSDVMKYTRSHKTLMKISECLRQIIHGLADNNFITINALLYFLYGVISKSIPAFSNKMVATKDVIKTKNNLEKLDCFIIPPEPKSRMGIKAAVSKTAGDTNDHLLLEFGLKLLHVLLKREKIKADTAKKDLDRFVPILADCVKSEHVKLSTCALLCLNWIIKMDMPGVHKNIKGICDSVFKILYKYASAGLSKGDNFDMVMAAFKTMSVVVRDVKHTDLTPEQRAVLIEYAEQDLYNSERQATAFKLIKAMINRKINVQGMNRVMEKVASLSVTSESDNVRQQSRTVFYDFLRHYKLSKKQLDDHLGFFIAQLGYETQLGRLSVLEMLLRIIEEFNDDRIDERFGFFFVKIGVRLVNDDDPACRKLVSQCLEKILQRVEHNQRTSLFDIVTTWFEDRDNIEHRFLAANVAGIFPNVEKEKFEGRLETLLPLILKQFNLDNGEDDNDDEPGRFVKRPKKNKKLRDKVQIKDHERLKDHHLFMVVQLTLKISDNCPGFLKNNKYIDTVKLLAEHCQSLLQHPHLWVRLAALKQLEFILTSLDEDKVSDLLVKSKDRIEQGQEEDQDETIGFVYTNPVQTLTRLSFDLVSQLYTEMEMEEFDHHVVRNLVLIAKFIKSITWKVDITPENNGDRISIAWLMKKIRKRVNMEVTQCPKSISVVSN